jgi:hypothetical protein
MKEVGFGLTGMAWNKGSWFWLDWNSFKLRKLVFGFIIKALEWKKSILA